MTTTFEDAKVGDQLWSIEFGWGEIVSRDIASKCFTIEFTADNFETYDTKGARKKPLREKMQTLFWDEVVFDTPNKPYPDLSIDAKVLVWNNSKEHAIKAHFFCFEDGKMITYPHGRTSHTYNTVEDFKSWHYWELV